MSNFEYWHGRDKKSQQILYLWLHWASFTKGNVSLLKFVNVLVCALGLNQYSWDIQHLVLKNPVCILLWNLP